MAPPAAPSGGEPEWELPAWEVPDGDVLARDVLSVMGDAPEPYNM
jgi:hypothetical protein